MQAQVPIDVKSRNKFALSQFVQFVYSFPLQFRQVLSHFSHNYVSEFK